MGLCVGGVYACDSAASYNLKIQCDAMRAQCNAIRAQAMRCDAMLCDVMQARCDVMRCRGGKMKPSRVCSHRTASHRIASHRISSHRITYHRIASHRSASQYIALYRIASPQALTKVLQYMPKFTLAAIVIESVVKLVDYQQMIYLWKTGNEQSSVAFVLENQNQN